MTSSQARPSTPDVSTNQVGVHRGVEHCSQGGEVPGDRGRRSLPSPPVHRCLNVSGGQAAEGVGPERRQEHGDALPVPSDGGWPLPGPIEPSLGPVRHCEAAGAGVEVLAAGEVSVDRRQECVGVCLGAERGWGYDAPPSWVTVTNSPPARWQSVDGSELTFSADHDATFQRGGSTRFLSTRFLSRYSSMSASARTTERPTRLKAIRRSCTSRRRKRGENTGYRSAACWSVRYWPRSRLGPSACRSSRAFLVP